MSFLVSSKYLFGPDLERGQWRVRAAGTVEMQRKAASDIGHKVDGGGPSSRYAGLVGQPVDGSHSLHLGRQN